MSNVRNSHARHNCENKLTFELQRSKQNKTKITIKSNVWNIVMLNTAASKYYSIHRFMYIMWSCMRKTVVLQTEIYTQFYIYLLDNKCSKEFDILLFNDKFMRMFQFIDSHLVWVVSFFVLQFVLFLFMFEIDVVMYDKWPFYNLNRSIFKLKVANRFHHLKT